MTTVTRKSSFSRIHLQLRVQLHHPEIITALQTDSSIKLMLGATQAQLAYVKEVISPSQPPSAPPLRHNQQPPL